MKNSEEPKIFIWSNRSQPAEERDTSNSVTVRYYNQGEQIPGATAPADKLFYTRDHLGSARELTVSTGGVRDKRVGSTPTSVASELR